MIAAVTMVKNECDIIAATMFAMLRQVDQLYVLDNGSTDGTRDILADLVAGWPITVIDDAEIGYYQSRRMSMLADVARADGARWIVPFDADEVWEATDGQSLRDAFGVADEAGHQLVQAALFDHVATADDPPETDPLLRIGWRRRQPLPLPKVAVRALPALMIHQGNHGASVAGTHFPSWTIAPGFPLRVRHYSNRSAEQFIAKIRTGAAAYAASDLPADMGNHWRELGLLGDDDLIHRFLAEHWSNDPENDETLVFDPLRP